MLTVPLMAGCYYKTDLIDDKGLTEVATTDGTPIGMHKEHYRATVTNGNHDGSGITRASLTPENKYVFADGDVLQIEATGENADKFYGYLLLQVDGTEPSSGAAFAEGDLLVADGFTPTDDMELKAVLVSADDRAHQLSEDALKVVSTNYAVEDALYPTLSEAVECCSDMTGTSTYGEMSFRLQQNACYVKFSIFLDDDTPAGTEINTYVWTNSNMEYNISRFGTVTAVDDDGEVKAKFVVAYPGGTVLDGAMVGLGSRTQIAFGGHPTVLEANKIYTVTRTFMREEGAIGYAQSTIVKSHPDLPFTNVLTNTGDGVVTYTSSNEAVATVDPATGEVTVTGAETATITATVADGVNYCYDDAERTANYLLVAYSPVALSAASSSQIGWVIGSDGRAYVTRTGVLGNGKTPVAVVGYVGEAGTADAASTSYRGLAVALADAAYESSESLKWSTALANCTANACNRWALAKVELSGIANTASLSAESVHVHQAAKAASDYTVGDFVPADHGCSDWFLPSSGQWYNVLGACGVPTYNWAGFSYCPDGDGGTANRADNYTIVQQLMAAGESSLTGTRYWTSTEYNANNGLSIGFSSANGVQITSTRKTLSGSVRPFFAF